ncbi:MAG: DNA-directed RNA polymerase subunit beta [Candidatus Magasanikbacteria bacterium RIFCSPHIGHO2_02_FULL_50_9b]|uniref:DNA-directed RNA polymerase subunit beta n=1 Tax=Candidatus Magasanikbacteria bacterium RIFCSPHIGHO2_02_FULL_50_9b TaxID=1798682 RepID=A0A1F6M7C4_9BACT|nr:MAG: DNA-directed RNA polymerase subunit beta [Candidatus Magasanikbacteria bacterium RIFCSPHIGHO2_02_FULL_50_9b]
MQFKRNRTIAPERVYFTNNKPAMELPPLTDLQTNSYKWFFDFGLRELFDEISPIRDFTGRDLELYFKEYYIDEPKFDEQTSRSKNITYEAPLRVKVDLVNKRTKESKEQEVYLGDLPLMTDNGTFIVNGIERVVVSQLIRSAGVFFTSEILRGRRYYGAKIIPNRGAWIEIETDLNNVLWCKVDRKRKASVSTLLRAFGYGDTEVIKSELADVNNHPTIDYVGATIGKDQAANEEEGLVEIYKRIRPGDLATPDNAKSLVHAMFFNFDRYDLGRVGRYKFNQRFAVTGERADIDRKDFRTLSKEDLLLIIREVIRLNVTQEEADDIDHLGNRRIRAVGELMQNRFRIGLARMERIVRDRMSTMDVVGLNPNKLINARPIIAAVREFFMSSQLSQFMDQINPLAELEHKRRLSALGPGGLSRDRAGFEVRDVHPTHYGRICPIATPEGPNIGLVGHLATFARVNEFGFIETPYRKVLKDAPNDGKAAVGEQAREALVDAKGKVIVSRHEEITKDAAKKLQETGWETIPVRPRVTLNIEYINAFQEEKTVTAAATMPIDEKGYFKEERGGVRKNGKASIEPVDTIDYVDVASNQIISVATSLIPFLEHDDATRALMGTNMQRQAVPCVKPDAPYVGTGFERRAAVDSGHVIVAPEDGEIVEADGAHIVMHGASGTRHAFRVNKYLLSNASTCINQRINVVPGQKVKKGFALADGPSTQGGELALGQNVLVAYMTWDGYNFEDAIILSDRVVKADRYTSIHINNYSIDIRETKLGPEVVTSDIPNVSEEKLKNLDAEGIVRIGAEVKSGDILVGKITPKGETELSAEEKLLRAIFGEKARDVRDTSMYLEHGEHGKVIDVKIFSEENGDKLQPGVIRQIQVSVADMRKIQPGDKLAGRHGNKGVISRVVPAEDMPFLEDGTPVDVILSPLGVISRMNLGQILENHLGLAANAEGIRIATPPLAGLSEEQIKELLSKHGFPTTGQVQLYDGRTGEAFDHKATVGYNYVLKLNHMVDDKIHQRSIGPYSLITQQPLGGRAQSGGQRFGEMEVWALEAYGAAHTLQEILTIKSDDVPGRSKAYESIIKGEQITKVNVPESFHVLIRELKGLALDVELLHREDNGTMQPLPDNTKPQPDQPRPSHIEHTHE